MLTRRSATTLPLRRPVHAWLLMVLCALAAASPAADQLGYDAKADPFPLVYQGMASAEASGKLVLVIAGGEWCHTCHVLEAFLRRHPDIKASIDQRFEIVKVYLGTDNTNDAFFSQLPALDFVPHFWVVSPDGRVLGSQSTEDWLDDPSTYNEQKVRSFVARWEAE